MSLKRIAGIHVRSFHCTDLRCPRSCFPLLIKKNGFCGKAQKQRRQESLNKGPEHHAILSIYCLLSIFYHILSSIGCCTGESAINKPTSGKRTAQSAPQLLMRIARHPPQQASASIEHGNWGSSVTVGLLMVLGYNML